MKKTILIVMALLCLKFWAFAQAVDVTTRGLQIGQKVPNISLPNIINYKDASGKSLSTVKLADLTGKLVIIDFWATWCAPCVASIPKLEKLQKQFDGKLQILPVTYQRETEVLPFLTKLKNDQPLSGTLPNVIADVELHQLFPHIYLPHYVWIDGNGIVRAITNSAPINEVEIAKAINQNYEGLVKKKDFKVAFDNNKPLFLGGNGGDGSTMVYHSMLSTYVLGITGGFSITPSLNGGPGFSKMLGKNAGIVRLFNMALGEGKYFNASKTIYETKDSLQINPSKLGRNWREVAWTYELSLPVSLQANGYQIMYAELSRFFPQYAVKLEKRKMACYALRKLANTAIAPSVGGTEIIDHDSKGLRMRNGSLNLFINTLEYFYFATSKLPIVNLVQDKTLTDLVINAPLTDVQAINFELTKYGLELIKGEFEIDVIVYRDSVK